MFGSFSGNNWQSGNEWGEQLLDTVATQSIARMFSECESIDVNIRCNPPSKLLQGAIDGFKMQGRNMVIRQQFPIAEMSFETDAVAIDPGSVIAGQLKLKQPTQALARVVLSEAGLTHSFKADLVQKRLQNLDLDGLTGSWALSLVSFEDVSMKLGADTNVTIAATAKGPGCPRLPLRFSTKVSVKRRRRIEFGPPTIHLDHIDPQHHEDARSLIAAMMLLLNDMVDLDRFDLDGITLRLNRLETEGSNLVFGGYAQVEHFPRPGQSGKSKRR